ncbi:hypothetical protein ACRE_090440 [Hapsidospora chrysogenum ATCC 11550]|uniref:Uncharacterized protein n=1 Tax=Hapsidospora chrysogenum (strain ATCC 11550 / CBS 779.69 / DSM 880 / IAM 14645 / JCM 23072 / IMI 49137) TaxID=857340 RepID=A0A086ST61_HAPC1|nr:hypothetical protein ACRE_090440 [Hapsidospora chrysogenum ATCC 11550]
MTSTAEARSNHGTITTASLTPSSGLSADFDIINCFMGHSAASFKTTTVLVVKFLRQRDGQTGQDEVFGKRMLVNGQVNKNLGGRTEEERLSEMGHHRYAHVFPVGGMVLDDE